MDRERLTRLIDEPARVQRDDIADLKAMAERYPWFSGAHLLLAVGGHREGDVLFDEQLRASAAHLPSRAVLFDRLHGAELVAPTMDPLPKPPAVERTTAIVPEPDHVPHEGTVRYGSTEDIQNPVTLEVEVPPTQSLLEVQPEPPPPAIAKPAAEAVPEPIEAPPPALAEGPLAEAPPPLQPDLTSPEHLPTPWKERLMRGDRDEEELDRQMRDSAVAISYELLLEREGAFETRSGADEPVEQNPPIAAPTGSASPPPAEPSAPPPVVSRRFSDWLSEEPVAVPAASSMPTRSPMAKPVEDPEIVRAVQQLPPIEPKHAPETAETTALVERFIKQNTGQAPHPKKAEFFNPQTAAKRSLEEHADLVTETLARIYEKQGNIAKAVAAYERLAVKHPEKSAHFRALAKALAGR